LVGGCATLSKPPAGPTTESLRDETLLDPGLPSLTVEVDYIQGDEPLERALRIFTDRLEFYCDKPGGIEVHVGNEIPAERWEPTRAGVQALTEEYAEGRPKSGGYLYVLYAPSLKKYRGYSFRTGKLGDRVDFPVIAIFYEQLKPILWLTGVRQEASVLVHETGHVMGLVTDDGHRDGGHCTNSWCLMYDGVDARSALVHLFPTLFTGYLPTHLCVDCREDLWGDDPVPGLRKIPGLPTDEWPGCDPDFDE